MWTWTAIGADTKLIPSRLFGERTIQDCWTFIADLRSPIKPGHRIQITTDGLGMYQPVIDSLLRDRADYAVMAKEYGTPPPDQQRRYSPATCTGIDVRIMSGDPDPDLISTSYAERQNLTMRMGMRRFTRFTNGFSKKVENLAHAVSLHFMHYNFCRPHQTLTKAAGEATTPAMAVGVADRPLSLTQLVEILEAWESAPGAAASN